MAGLLDFFSPEAGQRRTAALGGLVDRAEYYVPPELRSILGFAGEMSPVAGLQRAGQASERMLDPSRTGGQRFGDLGEMLSETAGVAAPMAVAGRAGMPVAKAVQEGLLGFSAGADDVGRRVLDRLNQTGPVPTMYSNPLGGRVVYRGDTGSNQKITGGISEGNLFVSPYEDVAKLYGDKISEFTIPDTARVLVEGTPEFAKVTGRRRGPLLRTMRQGENLVQASTDSVNAAKAAGYDAVEFNSMRDLGISIINPDILTSNALTTPSRSLNPAERMAKDILDMRAAGRAGEVTEEMMAQADPQYMYFNTPLPMDEASRMARRDALYGKDRYHGGNMDFQGFSGNVFTSDNPTVASTYNRGTLDGQIYPVVTRDGPMGTVTVEGGGSNWNYLSPEMFDDAAVARGSALYPHPGTGELSTRGTERAAAFEGRSGVTFKDIHDLGPGFNSQQFKGVGYTPEQSEALRQQYLAELSGPSEIDVRLSPNLVRSRFARFDPEFKHLRNLSAGVGGMGLLGMSYPQEEQY